MSCPRSAANPKRLALTDAKGGVTAFAWSPDSKRIAFVATVPLTDAQEKAQKDKDDARVVDGDYRFSHLWVIEAESKKKTLLQRLFRT